MSQFEFKRTSRKCARSGRAFQAGEEYYSLLLEDEDGQLTREDVAVSEFAEPPENCVGWWKSKVPDLEKNNVYWAPKDVLLTYFQRLVERDDCKDVIYVMAILLMQKKFLRQHDSLEDDSEKNMTLICNSSKASYEVEIVDVSAERVSAIQQQLAETLFTDIAPSEG